MASSILSRPRWVNPLIQTGLLEFPPPIENIFAVYKHDKGVVSSERIVALWCHMVIIGSGIGNFYQNNNIKILYQENALLSHYVISEINV